jgi:DNA-binding NarL/FixJ family response regulator
MRELSAMILEGAILEGAPSRAPAGYPVLIIDDHDLFSTSLGMALRGQGFHAQQVPVPQVAEVLSRPCPGPSGLVVLDLDLGRDAVGNWVNGADLVRGLREQGWQVLIVSGSVDKPVVAVAIAAGAIGSVPKSSSFDLLLETVVMAAAGHPVMTEVDRQQWLHRHHTYLTEERKLSRRLSQLSNREREVLELLAEGYRAAAIAERFVVSMTTVRAQIRSILAKLEVTSQLEAVALVHQQQRW